VKKLTQISLILLVIVLCAGLAQAQSPKGTVIDNVSPMKFHYLNGSVDSARSNKVTVTVAGVGKLTLNKTVSPTVAMPGDTVQFNIIVTNAGTDRLTVIEVYDTLSASFGFIASSGANVSGNILSWNIPVLLTGTSDTIKIKVRVSPAVAFGSLLANSCSATDSSGKTIVASTELVVGSSPHFTLVKSASKTVVNAGDTLAYTLIYKNDGNIAGTNVSIIDTLPAGSQFVSASNGGVYLNGIVTWNFVSINAGSTNSLTLRVLASKNVSDSTHIANTATLRSSGGISVSSNTAETIVKVWHPKLMLTKTASADSINPGDNIHYIIRFANDGDTTLTRIHIIDTLSGQMRNVTVSANATLSNGIVTYVKDSLSIGALDSITINGSLAINAPAGVEMRNTAYAITDQTGRNSSEAHSFVKPLEDAELSVSKVASSDSVFVGDSVKYTIIVKNSGATLLTNITVADTLPLSLRNISVSSNAALTGQAVHYQRDTLKTGIADTISVIARLDSALGNGVTINNIAHAKTDETVPVSSFAKVISKIVPAPAIQFGKFANADTVIVGDSIHYTLWFRNSGNIPLINVSIVDTLPAQLFGITAQHGTVTNDSIVSFAVNQLEVGAVDTLNITARVRGDLTALQPITNTGYCKSNQTSTLTATAKVIARLIPVADLFITKTVSKDTILVGSSVEYRIRIRNTGNMFLNGVTVTDTIPGDLSNISVSKGTLTGHILSYSRDTLSAGMQDTIGITASVPSVLRPYRVVVNNVFAKANETSIRSARANFVTQVVPAPSMSLSKTVSKDSVLLGDTLSYSIHFRNTGNSDLTHFAVIDTLPSQLLNIRTSSNALVNGSIVRYAHDTLYFNGEDSITIHATMSNARLMNEVIVNSVVARSNELAPLTAEATTHSKFIVKPSLSLSKSVSAETVLVGSPLIYTIRFANTGNMVLHNVEVLDTLPSAFANYSVSGNASISGKIVTGHRDSLQLNEKDSILVYATVPSNTANKLSILNTVYASANEVTGLSAQAATVTKVIVTDYSCLLKVNANPTMTVGDGIHASLITALLTDATGHPKPDGTPVSFSSSIGIFSNGLNAITVPTVNGYATDSIRTHLASNTIATAFISASSHDSDICYSTDSVQIAFYPAAITGIVTDHITGLPVKGGRVVVSDNGGSYIGSMNTASDGGYIIPISTTGDYHVTITTTDLYKYVRAVTSIVHVDVPVSGGNPPVSNKNSISGSIYFSVSNSLVKKSDITVFLLNPGTTVSRNLLKNAGSRAIQVEGAIDSAHTDSTGYYSFNNIVPGSYSVAIQNQNLQGQISASSSLAGETVIDANIPVVLNSDLTLSKTGPAEAFSNDTVSYIIDLQNASPLNMTNPVVIDSLDPLMIFVGASDNGSYEPDQNRIVWTPGTLASMENRSLIVRVTFRNSVSTPVQSVNRASVTTDQTMPEFSHASTLVRPPAQLRIWKTVSAANAGINDSLSYTIFVQNNAGSTANSLVIEDMLPSEIVYQSSAPAAEYDSTTRTLRWRIDSLSVGQLMQYRVVARVRADLQPGAHIYTNIADVIWHGGRITSRRDPASHATVSTVITYITITKQALKKLVEVGDAVTYVINVTNMSPDTPAESLLVIDDLPGGFTYQKGSSLKDSFKIPDPKGDRELRWLLSDTLPPGATVRLTYRLIAGAGAVQSDGINTAQAKAISNGATAMASSKVQEKVEVKQGLFSEHGIIIGKVFYDDNLNAYQDQGEEGVKGVELMMEDGTRIMTGDDGKYSLPDVLPGEHVIRVRKGSLPQGTSLHAGYSEFAGDPVSRFVRVTESGIARADFYLKSKHIVAPDTLRFSRRISKFGRISVQRVVEPKNLVFVDEQGAAPLKLSGSQFEVGKADLRPEAFQLLKGIGDVLREYSNQTITIAGHTDSKPIHTKEFPSNQVLSEARANSVKRYLVESEHIDSNRISTIGFGEARPIMTNETNAGRAANRRVELHLSGSVNQPVQFVGTVTFTIPIFYSGDNNLKTLEIHDVLDTAYHFIQGSGRIGVGNISPRIEGADLYWTIDNVDREFHQTLTYRANIYRPAAKHLSVASKTMVKFSTSDSTEMLPVEAVTTNELASSIRAKGMKFTISGITFDAGLATLKESMLGNLVNVVDILKNNPQSTVVIDGHTDSNPIHTREFESNVELSHARAVSVLEYLVKQTGMDAKQFSAFGWGELRPVASNSTNDGRQANRRVEIQVFKKEFEEETIKEGFIDSSKVIMTEVAPGEHSQQQNTSASGEIGDRFRLTMDLAPATSPDLAARTISIVLPHGLNIVGNWPGKSSGDTITISDTTITHPRMFSFVVEITPDASGNTELKTRVTIFRKFSSGHDLEDRMEPIIISLKTK
jgi:uncharacterized repeat protein (TIGR01451 family)